MDSQIAKQLDDMSERFDGLKGDLVAAALWMFFKAKADEQRQSLKSVMGAKVDRLFGEEAPASTEVAYDSAFDTLTQKTPEKDSSKSKRRGQGRQSAAQK